MLGYSHRFLEKISKLGQITEINDETLYLVFSPRNGLGAKLTARGGLIDILTVGIENYSPLTMRALLDGQYWNLTEKEAEAVLIGCFES